MLLRFESHQLVGSPSELNIMTVALWVRNLVSH